MFGSKRIQELESQLRDWKSKAERELREKDSLTEKLQDAKKSIADLQAKLKDTDLERMKEEARSAKAEYEGLRDLYAQKIKAFDDSREEEEQKFARDAALQRYQLENEIKENRASNEAFVSKTVQTFSESYNYYLNQIKLMMDALGNVAAQTGEALFSQDTADLKAKFGQKMVEKLRSDTDQLRQGEGDLLLIGAQEAALAEEAAEEADETLRDLKELDSLDQEEASPEEPEEEPEEEPLPEAEPEDGEEDADAFTEEEPLD